LVTKTTVFLTMQHPTASSRTAVFHCIFSHFGLATPITTLKVMSTLLPLFPFGMASSRWCGYGCMVPAHGPCPFKDALQRVVPRRVDDQVLHPGTGLHVRRPRRRCRTCCDRGSTDRRRSPAARLSSSRWCGWVRIPPPMWHLLMMRMPLVRQKQAWPLARPFAYNASPPPSKSSPACKLFFGGFTTTSPFFRPWRPGAR
jgi:hypothetical protein